MSPSPESEWFDNDSLYLGLSDGRVIAAPLVWFPRLLEAASEQRAQVALSKRGLNWDALDEAISVAGLLAGKADTTRRDMPRIALHGDRFD